MINSEYVKLIVFYFELKLLFPLSGSPETGIQPEFILLPEAIRQCDYLIMNSREKCLL